MAVKLTERYEDAQEALLTFADSHQSGIWTALPGIIQSFNPDEITVTVQPAIQGVYTGGNLHRQNINLPVLQDVPVVFPHGGTYALTFPIQAGDECLVVFSSRCIDTWWDQGGVQPQAEFRMHDLSDGFAIVGPYSKKTKISNISTKTLQLRTADDTIFIEIDQPNKKVNVIDNNISFVLDASANTATVTLGSTIFKLDGNANTATMTTGSSSFKLDGSANTATLVANLVVTGNMSVSGTTTVTGAATINGATQINNNLQASGNIIAGAPGSGSVNLITHKHGYSGGQTTQPISGS